MGRQAIHTADIKIEQKDDVADTALADRAPEIVRAEQLPKDDYLDELKFNEEPVMIRLEPSSEKNAATSIPIWVDGKGAEVWMNNRWCEITYLPVGQQLITKRKYVAVLACAKLDTLETKHDEPGAEVIGNRVTRRTSGVMMFSVLEDKNPRGASWLTELRRRNF
jgi:hypothetical protein